MRSSERSGRINRLPSSQVFLCPLGRTSWQERSELFGSPFSSWHPRESRRIGWLPTSVFFSPRLPATQQWAEGFSLFGIRSLSFSRYITPGGSLGEKDRGTLQSAGRRRTRRRSGDSRRHHAENPAPGSPESARGISCVGRGSGPGRPSSLVSWKGDITGPSS